MRSKLEIRLFGQVEVLRDGRPLPLPASKKTRALLAFLIATEREHTRERLCDLLWEGPDDPRAALRWSLAKLRPVLDQPGIARLVADRERAAFQAHGAEVDLYKVRATSALLEARTVSTEALEAVAALLRGELLEGLELPDCYRYSEWCRAEREAARGHGRAIRLSLIERLEDQPDQALSHARALCSANALDQTAHVAVIELLHRLGRNKDALRQYETCRRILAAELGAQPSAELERARSALGSVRPTKASAADTGESSASSARVEPSSADETSLVGRGPECAAIEEFVRLAPASQPALFVLGEPGVGKTRLLSELGRYVRAQGGTVLQGRAFEAEMIRPYGAWIDALRSAGDTAELNPFAVRDSDGPEDRARLFEAVVARLRGLTRGDKAIIVLIDDIHWIDEASAALIHYAARALENTRARIACAARPGELSDNAAARRLVRALTREGKVCQIGLSALDQADTGALARSIGAEIDVDRVFAESGGNPLFALEVARALSTRGESLGSLDALLSDRLDRLEGSAREVVSWAAALGGAFSTDILLRVTGAAPAELVRAAEELERRGFIRPAANGSGYDFTHDLMRKAAYRAVSEPRRRLMHAVIARALSTMPDADGALAGDLAHHAALGDEVALAARASLAAAERCVRLFANDEALELVERGLRHTAQQSGREKAQIELGLLRAGIYASVGKPRAAAFGPAMEQAILHAQSLDCADEVTRGLLALSYLRFNTGDLAGAARDSIRAEQQTRAGDPIQSLRAIAHAAQCLVMIERELPRAEAMAAEAVALAVRYGDNVPELWLAQALISYHRGEIEAAIVLLGRAFSLAARAEEHWMESLCLSRLAMSELLCARPDEALAHCAKLLEVASRMGESGEAPLAAVLQAVARRERGESGSNQMLDTGLDALRAIDAQSYLAEALCFAAETDLRAGAFAIAAQRATEALRASQVSGRPTLAAWAHTLLARAAFAAGDREAVHIQLDFARALIEAQPSPSGLARARIEQAELLTR